MTEWVEQWICSKVCIKLEHSSKETIWMIQKDVAMGNWWLAASSWQCACSCITSGAVFWQNTIIIQVTQRPLQPRCGTLWFLAFPKTKITFKGKRFQTSYEIKENTMGQQTEIGRTVWGPQGAYFEGDWSVIVLCTMFLVSSSENVSTFHSAWLDTFWTSLVNSIVIQN